MDLQIVKALGFEKRDTEHYEYPRLCKFQDHFDLDGFKAALARKPAETVANNCLYLHVPFCSTICAFCNYYKVLDRGADAKDEFVTSLVTEIEIFSKLLHPDKRVIRGIHCGGGTPTLLTHEQWQRVLSALRRCFDLSGCELLSLEGTLASLDREKISSLVDLGFNRVSFGVQTLDPEIRRGLGVRYAQEALAETCQALREYGLDNYNADLMYNLPKQDPSDVLCGIDELFGLGATNIDLYFLNVYPKTNIEKVLRSRNEWDVYNDALRQHDFGLQIYSKIAASSAIHLIFSNTISMKSKRVHCTLANALGNNKYEGGNQLSLGPSSRGYVDGYIYKNEVDLAAYSQNVRTHGLGYSFGRQISQQEAEDRTMVLFPNFTYVNKADVRGIDRHRAKIDFLLERGVLRESVDRLEVTPEYMFFNGNLSAFFQSTEEKQRAMKSYFMTRRLRLNMYNQDTVNIVKQS